MLNPKHQEKNSPNELAKSTEIPPFSGVIDSNFAQRIPHNYIKPPRAFLFSKYILSKIQRRLGEETGVVKVRDFSAYTAKTPAVGQQDFPEDTLTPEETSKTNLPSSLSQALPLKTSVNKFGPVDLQTAGEGDSATAKAKSKGNSDLLFSQGPTSFLSVKPQEGIITQDFLQKKEEESSQSGALKGGSNLSLLQGLKRSFSSASPESEKPSPEPISEALQIEASSTPSSNLERSNLFRQPVSSVPVSMNDVSFADTVAEKSRPEVAKVSKDIPSQIGNLNLATLHNVAPASVGLTYMQRQVEPPGTRGETKETGIQLRASSESAQMDISKIPSSNIGRIGTVSSAPMNTNELSFADKVSEKSRPETFTVARDIHSRIGQVNLATRLDAPTVEALTHVQRQVEPPDEMDISRAPTVQTPTSVSSNFAQPKVQVKPSAESSQSEASAISPPPDLEPIGLLPKPVSSIPLSRNDSSFARTVAEKSISEVVRVSKDVPSRTGNLNLATFHDIASTGGELTHIQQTSPRRQDEIFVCHLAQTTMGVRPLTDFSALQTKIITAQDESREGLSETIYRQPDEQIQKSPNSDVIPVTSDKTDVLQRSSLPSSIRPVSITNRDVTEEISGNILPNHAKSNGRPRGLTAKSNGRLCLTAGGATRIFRRHLDMPHIQLNQNESGDFMASLKPAPTIRRQAQQTSASNNIAEASQYNTLENSELISEQTALSLLNIGSVHEPNSQTFTSPQIDASMIARKQHFLERDEGLENFGDEPVDLTPIQRTPQMQYAMPQSVSNPSLTEGEVGTETVASEETSALNTSEPTTPRIDINRIAEEVYEIIERRLRSEKERRGYF